MPLTLEDRFKSFLRQIPSSEEIDSLELPNGFEKRKKADYLLLNRKIIIELKTLKSDTSHKEAEGTSPRFFVFLLNGGDRVKEVVARYPLGIW